jgi:hypothetical protein
MREVGSQIGSSGLGCVQYVVSLWNLTNRLETFPEVRFLSWGRPDEQGFNTANYQKAAQRIAFGFVFAALCMGALPAAAQQPQQPPPASASTQTPSKPDEKSNGDQNSTSQQQEASPKNDRIFWTLPNYLTVENAAHVPPLTIGGKFKLTAQDSFDPVEIPYIGLLAGISHAQNSEPSYGQGAAGYGRRYGTAFADNTIGNFMTEAIFPSMLRQDPRYFQLAKGGFWRRTGYAFSRLVVTRTDSGHSQFNYSEIAGNAVAAGIASTYHPAQDRTFSNTMSIWGTQIMWDGLAMN